MASAWGLSWGRSWGNAWGAIATTTRAGGDDAPGKHTGWNKRAWLRSKKRDERIEQTILETWQELCGYRPDAEVVAAVVRQAESVAPEVIQPERIEEFDAFQDWLAALQARVAELIRQRIADEDEDEVMMLLLSI